MKHPRDWTSGKAIRLDKVERVHMNIGMSFLVLQNVGVDNKLVEADER